MKKFFILVLILMIAGCKPLDRVNPTDPKSSNYIGITYKGMFGEFSNLIDFVVFKDYLICISEDKGYNYNLDGKLNFYWSEPQYGNYEFLGISKDDNYIYLLSHYENVSKYVEIYNISNEILASVKSFIVDSNAKKIVVSGNYCFVSLINVGVKKYDKSTGNFILDFPIVEGQCNSCVSKISAIEAHSDGNILVADPILKKIVIFDNSGNFLRVINLGFAIDGFAIKENTLLIPSENGVHEISYVSGDEVKKWGDYGEGNGKITSPSIIDFYGDKIFIGNKTSIKYFAP